MLFLFVYEFFWFHGFGDFVDAGLSAIDGCTTTRYIRDLCSRCGFKFLFCFEEANLYVIADTIELFNSRTLPLGSEEA